MKSIISLFAATWLLIIVSDKAILDGPCSQFGVSDVQPFFKKLFMGNWYLYGVYDNADITGLDCITFFYQLTADGNARALERSKNLSTNTRGAEYSIMIFDRPGAGHYIYEVPAENISESIQIIATDYIRYFIEFECADTDGKSDCYVGIMTRFPFPDPVTISRINRFLDAHHIDKSQIRYINHDKIRCM